ncbi:MAG: ABC transporter ATP-binding protein, partial [Gemmatimonadota bacterium]|nr:ABC transporter ATP-binding protein [Gemmatimonadota bacterium]
MARIALEHVDKIYPNGYVAARDLSLEASDGELLVLVGPSGSGKSTVLRLMAGLEQVTDGVIRIGERDVTDLPPQQRDIAMVFQNYALYPHMTVRQNLGFGLSIRKQPRAIIEER